MTDQHQSANWRPIQTAPRGRYVLLWDGERPYVARQMTAVEGQIADARASIGDITAEAQFCVSEIGVLRREDREIALASEVLRLLWEQVDLDDAVLGPWAGLPAALVKHKRFTRIPLSPAAVALLRWLPPRESRQFGEAALVFAGRGNRPVGGWTDVRRALLREARVADGTLHDIRRTVVSTLGDRGWEPAVVDRLLNHAAAATMGGVMGVYQRSELWEQQRKAIEAWAEILLGEAARLQRRPLDRETWGFDQPFTEARIRRPRRARARAAA